MEDMNAAILNDEKYIFVDRVRFEKLSSDLEEYTKKESNWRRLVELKHTAQGLEKSGDLINAFAYKLLIEFSVANKDIRMSSYSYDINRFRIVYKKLKRLDEYTLLLSNTGLDNFN